MSEEHENGCIGANKLRSGFGLELWSKTWEGRTNKKKHAGKFHLAALTASSTSLLGDFMEKVILEAISTNSSFMNLFIALLAVERADGVAPVRRFRKSFPGSSSA